MNETPEINAGYLIVKTFECMYREHSGTAGPGDIAYYSIPRVGVPAQEIPKKYRGISRDALEAWEQEDLELGFPGIPTPTETDACLEIAKIEEAGMSAEDFIFSPDGARRVFSLLVQPDQWELIWACRREYVGPRPAESLLLGFEPTWWTGDHFSAVMDSMCFPRWHGPDPDASLLIPFHDRLNQHALFESVEDAEEFLVFYRSQDWAETGDFVIAEIRLVL